MVVDDEWTAADVLSHPGLLSRFDKPGSELHKALHRRQGNRLGDYFEVLINTWMDAIPEARVMFQNYQVTGGKGTVGEFDLVFERDRETHHWELAIKYYLGHPGPDGEPYWYGPNPVDRLDLKWTKMVDKQLKLSRTKEGLAALKWKGFEPPIRPRAFMKGYLYEPLNPDFAVPHHEDTNADGLRGWWCHADEFLDAVPEAERWFVAPRLRWMSPICIGDEDALHGPESLPGRAKSHSIHVMAMQKVDGVWEEMSRGFIMKSDWPKTA